jgi:hypothetical protein
MIKRRCHDYHAAVQGSTGTYTHLRKPSLNSVANNLQIESADREGWDPATTLNWSSRGVGPRKMSALRDTLMSNAHVLTGIQLSGM